MSAAVGCDWIATPVPPPNPLLDQPFAFSRLTSEGRGGPVSGFENCRHPMIEDLRLWMRLRPLADTVHSQPHA